MNLDVALGSMKILVGMGRVGLLDSIGVSRGDFDRFVGDDPWLQTDRYRMAEMIHALANASLDAQGLPRFSLPAEYIAATIAMFVHPMNALMAARIAPPAISAADGGRGVTPQPCTSEQIFALLVQLYAHSGRGQARASFEKLTKVSLDKQLGMGVELETSSGRRKNA